MTSDYYEMLGVERSASEKDVRTAYRRLARQYHPDVNRGNDTAEAKFKEINEAYQVLSNAEDRKKYDRFGHNWRNAGQYERQNNGASARSWFTRTRQGSGNGAPNVGLGGIFGDLFGAGGGGGFHVENRSPFRRPDIPVTLGLEEAYAGTSRAMTIPAHPSAATGARRLDVSIPAGVRSGSRVHVGVTGQDRDLGIYLVVTVSPHKTFQRTGDDLLITVKVPLLDMVLGGEVEVPTIAGKKVALMLPPETENGKVFRLKGKGMPRSRGGVATPHGDQLVTVQAVLPRNMGTQQRKLFEQLQDFESGEV